MSFLCEQSYDTIHILRIKFTTTVAELSDITIENRGRILEDVSGNKISCQVEKKDINSDNAITVISLKDAEEKAIDYILENVVVSNGRHIVPLDINHQSNLIASHTRRGAGNTVIIHPNNVNKLTLFYEGDTITISDNLKIIENAYMPLDKAIVLYKGSDIDGSMFFAGETTKYLYMIKEEANCLGSFSDFITVIDI